jgi:hypothetical protein
MGKTIAQLQHVVSRPSAEPNHNIATLKKEEVMSITLAVRSASSSTLKVLAACLMFLAFTQLPAYADHIHHLWYNNSDWQDVDLTALTGAGIAYPEGAVAAFRTTPNNQLHVFYVAATNNHLNQLYYNGTSWVDEDLTSFTGGPTAESYTMSGFAIGNLQYVFYTGLDFHVHETYYNNSDWQDLDVTAAAGGTTSSGAELLAFTTTPNNEFHVFYQQDDTDDLHQLFFNGTSWVDNDLTSITGGAYCYADWLAGFSVGNLQHVFCAGYAPGYTDLSLLHIYYNNSTWKYEVIDTGGRPMELGAGIAGFKVPKVNQLELYSITDDTDFNRFYHVVKPSQWVLRDLSAEIGAPTDAQYGQIVAFVTTPNDQYHIYYAPTTEVYQLYYNGSYWSIDDLTGGAGNADPNSGMAGFAIGNLQHVFYMSND